ncbi:TPR-like protein [Annulohypoxylon maeteangense]|uniref:TPR-like protein n=1 Tax=Annulohypoxylon maeteangense TaxID=1927788 RepID=UPI0020086BCF|nr:TPR-like protein [Annulohypoxylon maeteangense]KAI0890323.1 TPR-like protein [Annulohypoxylon maeteangense]
MSVEEISDEIADRLKISEGEDSKSQSQEGTPQQPSSQNAPTIAPLVMFPALSPGRAMTERKTVDEVVAELKKTPFFMTELEENDDTEALKALAYEGTPFEVASEFKESGNECFRVKRWADAKEFYTKGVLVLAAEERKRAKGEPQDPDVVVTEDDIKAQRGVLESLYVNRAACHLELRNYRSCWLDGAAALRLNPKNVKAYYRSARAFLAVGRIEEADDACARGLEIDEGNKPLKGVAQDIVTKHGEITAKQKKESERLAKEKRRETLVKASLQARFIKTRTTAQPPEMEDAKLQLVPDPDDPRSSLSFPTVLLYPAHLQSDFVKAFNEMDTLADHLAYIFPLPWDTAQEYTLAGVECYMETLTGGLVKVGKKVPLLKALSGNVEVVDEVVRLFVLPKAKAAAWIQEFKIKKMAEKGGG